MQDCLYLGNLDSKRDWGHAKDYVVMQWMMLQQEKPEDFVIATNQQKSVREFEPHLALYSGPDGLEALRSWSEHAFKILRPTGRLILEFGAGQSQEVRQIIERVGFGEIEFARDLGGHERVLAARKI